MRNHCISGEEKSQITVLVIGLHAADNPSPGVAVARLLVEAGYSVVGICYSVLETGALSGGIFRSIFFAPSPSDGAELFLERLVTVFKESGASILIPTLDPDVVFFAKRKAFLREHGIRCLIPDLTVLQRTLKVTLADIGRQCGFHVPQIYPAYSLKEAQKHARNIGMPLMIKGAWYEAHEIGFFDEIPYFFRKLKQRWGLPVLLQAKLVGSEAVVSVLCDRPGHVSRSLSLRKFGMSDQGTTWCGVIFKNDALLVACNRLMDELKWIGPSEVEVMMHESSGMISLLEVNMRFPSWIGIGAEVGSNQPADLVRILEGYVLEPDPGYQVGRVMVRQYLDKTVPMARLVALEAGGVIHG